MLGRTLKMAFWVFFDHLGKLLVANLVAACMVLAPLALAHAALLTGNPASMFYIGVPLLLLAVCVAMPVAMAGLFVLIRTLIEKHDGSLKLFFRGMGSHGWALVRLAVIYMIAAACFVASVFFYGYRLGEITPLLGYGLSALAVWLLFFLILTGLYVGPAAVYKKSGTAASIKMAGLLVIDNPLFTLGLLLHVFIVAGLAILPPALLFFSFSPLAVLQCSAYEILSRKYNAIQAYREKTGGRVSVAQIDFGDEDDEYLCRGLRDLLFPWKE